MTATIATETTITQAPTTALLTDHYELTMLEAAMVSGVADKHAVFELFARRLPEGYRYGVFAGLGRIIDAVERFRFDPDELSWLVARGVIQQATADRLAGWRFGGTIRAYREGELYFAYSPVIQVEGTFADCVILETVMLSIVNHDAAIASKASRIVQAAGGRKLIEMGSRRTQEGAAVAAARAAYIAGFDATSNLEAGRSFGVPTTGTAAHAFTLAHLDGEQVAFRAQMQALGTDTTLLVDTYDIPEGIRAAVVAARDLGVDGPGAIRLDSGDLYTEAHAARRLLDELGATDTRIVVSSDLDEHTIATLADAPVDGYGVGTKLVSVAPGGFVYKLVAIADDAGDLQPVEKRSTSKGSAGGRKYAFRELSYDGYAVTEHITAGIDQTPMRRLPGRDLQVPVVIDGEVVHRPNLEDARRFHADALAELMPLDRDPTATRTLTGAAVRTNTGR